MFKHLISIFALLSLLLVVLRPGWTQNWSEFRSPAGEFRVEMPGVPTVKAGSSHGGTVKNSQMAILDVGSRAYAIAHADFPGGSITAATVEADLEDMLQHQVGSNRLESRRNLTIAGQSGREFAFRTPGNEVVVVRLVFVGDRFYHLVVAGPVGTEQDFNTRRFLESFAVTLQ